MFVLLVITFRRKPVSKLADNSVVVFRDGLRHGRGKRIRSIRRQLRRAAQGEREPSTPSKAPRETREPVRVRRRVRHKRPGKAESTHSAVSVVIACATIWLLMRIFFFVGLAGSDDLRYMRYAALWDRIPANTWEARLLGNGLTAVSMAVFGRNEVAAAIPSMLASAAVLGCVLYWCLRRQSSHYAFCAGMLVAVLPLDVEMATTVSPYMIMVAFMSIGTVLFVMRTETLRWRVLGAAFLGLGFVTHFAGVYYVAALCAAALIVDFRRYWSSAWLAVGACALFLCIEIGVYHAVFGAPFARFHACLAETGYIKPIMPQLVDGSWNLEYFTWPIRNLLFSKGLGIALILVVLAGALRYRALEAPDRILLLTIAGFWLWMSYGSEVPWRYVSFDRIGRFLQPLTVAIAILFAVLIGTRRSWWLSSTAISLVFVVCVLNLMGGGPWGQNVHVSGELLAYARANPRKTFVTDYRTLNEMYILNGVKHVENVVGIDDGHRSRLLDWTTDVLREDQAVTTVDEILVNRMNLPHAEAFGTFLSRHGGAMVHHTGVAFRQICYLVPPLRDHKWAQRRPPAIVRACVASRAGHVADSEYPD